MTTDTTILYVFAWRTQQFAYDFGQYIVLI